MIAATATTFFGPQRRLAGWYTPPAPGTASRDTAILLCQPIGHEYMCSHRAFRILARDLAALGFAVLRFDYYGTGDSAGPLDDKSLVPEWIDNVLLAADELLRRSGCCRIAMAGLRFGATLAAKAAEKREDVDALVLWSPTVSGRSFVRQTRMLAVAAVSQPDSLVSEEQGLESVGFLLGPATVVDVTHINMRDVAYSVGSVLVMSRSDGSSEQDLLTAIARDGVQCEEKMYDDQARFMVTPLHSVLPYAALSMVARWLDDQFPAVERSPGRVIASIPENSTGLRSGDGVIESGVTFSRRRIAGVMAEPSSPSDNPAVVLLNTGADHHVGPHRMYVPLARRWAALGFSVLRFDLVGLGDSESNDRMPVNDSYPLSALNDVRDAISFLRHERGYRSIILAGMCSGAFHSLHAAEPLLSAVIAVNPSLFHHAGDPILPDPHYNNVTEARRVAASLFRPAKWRRLVEGKVDVVTSVNVLIRRCFNAITNATAAIARTITNEKSDSELAADLFFKELPVHLIFNEGDKAQLFFEREIAPRLKRRDHGSRVTIDIVPGADHTFMALRWQSELADLMTNRLLEYRSSDLQTPAPPAAESIAGVRS